jgi:hypothetical protein
MAAFGAVAAEGRLITPNTHLMAAADAPAAEVASRSAAVERGETDLPDPARLEVRVLSQLAEPEARQAHTGTLMGVVIREVTAATGAAPDRWAAVAWTATATAPLAEEQQEPL